LTEGRLAEFHTELELIFHPEDRIALLMENVFIKRAVELSQALEEGRFRKVSFYRTKTEMKCFNK